MLATMLFVVTALAMGFTVWQQRRAEKLAAVRPDEEEHAAARRTAGRLAGARPASGS